MSRWGTITERGAAALRIIVASPEPIARSAVAKAICTPVTAIGPIVERLVASGHVAEVPRETSHKGRAPLLVATPEGRAGMAQDIAPAAAVEPVVVCLSPRAAKLVTFLRAEAAAGRVPSQTAMGAELGTDRGNVHRYLEEAVRAGCLTWSTEPRALRTRARLTPLGVAVADGSATVEAPVVARRESVPRRRQRAPRPAQAPRARQPVAAPAEPITPPPVAPREPVDVGPAVPPGFDVNAPRPIRHPAPPAPGQRDPRQFTPSYWDRITNAPVSGLHTASMRGTA